MTRIRLLLLLGLMTIGAPLGVAAGATPAAKPGATCVFPPISIDLLREIRDEITVNPPPTPTMPTTGISDSRAHLMPFPPPAGEPMDDATEASVRHFLAQYETCLHGGRVESVYGAWTEGFIRRTIGGNVEFADGLIRAIELEVAIFPYPFIHLLLLQAWQIDGGHVVAVVQVIGTEQYWTMLLLPHGDSWRIDDLWDLGPDQIGDNLTGPVYGTPVTDE